MATSKKSSDNPRISLDQMTEVIASGPARGDALRGAGFAALIKVKQAKLGHSRRERTRLAERHGEDSAEVARLDRQLGTEHGFLVSSRAESARIATPKVVTKSNLWQLHGYVRNQDGHPRNRYKVGLYEDAEGIEPALATATTNASGYFRLSWQPPTRSAPKAKSKPADDKSKAEPPEIDKPLPVLERPLYVGTLGGKQAVPVMDSRALHPASGAIAYRDLVMNNDADTGKQCHLTTRLLGNSASRELHDLDNEKRGCRIAAMRPDHRVYFASETQAEKIGYDFCVHCFGKTRSKR